MDVNAADLPHAAHAVAVAAPDDQSPTALPRRQEVLSRQELCSSPFLRMTEVTYTRPPEWERPRRWQMVERPTSRQREDPTFTDAVCVLCVVRQEGRPPHLVVVKQFRPPVGKYTVELPAGLVDAGETFQQAALRELREETGFTGVITGHTGVQYLSPGLTNECVRTVTVEAQISAEQPAGLQSADDAFIEVALLPLEGLTEALQELEAEGFGIKAMLWSFAQGLAFTRTLP